MPFLGHKFLEMLETEPRIFFDCILTAADINTRRKHSEVTPEKVHGVVGGGGALSPSPASASWQRSETSPPQTTPASTRPLSAATVERRCLNVAPCPAIRF